MSLPVHIFVYGTLKPGATNFDRYCGNKVIASHRAYIHGELYHFPSLGYPGTIHGHRQVHGFVLTFADVEILNDLDRLEDYDSQRQPAANDYMRELVMTYTPEGIPLILAWAYLMTPDRIHQWGGILCPEGCWIDGNST